jgi:hypothetical protein
MAAILQRCLRRIVACWLAYALVLQSFVIAFASTSSAVAAAQNPAFVAFQLCSHDGSTTLPDAPSRAPFSDNHCAFCIVGTIYVNFVSPCAWECRFAVVSIVWSFRTSHLVALFARGDAWPRGPPAAS